MKKLVFVLVISMVLIGSVVCAADVVITITIPDAYVSRVAAAVEHELICQEGDNAKVCLTKHIISVIKRHVRSYERGLAQETFDTDFAPIEVQ